MPSELRQVLRGKLRFDRKELAFCTHYSWFGVAKKQRLGIEELHLFYNRRPGLLSPNFLTFRTDYPDGGGERQRKRSDLPLSIEETDGRGFAGVTAFVDCDIICYHLRLKERSGARAVRATLLLPPSEPRLARSARFDTQRRLLVIETRTPRTDDRDPDPDHALTVCVAIPAAFSEVAVIADGSEIASPFEEGAVTTDGALALHLTASAADLGAREHTFVVGIGEGPTADRIEERTALLRAVDSRQSSAASEKWLRDALESLSLDQVPRGLRVHYAKSVYQILSNTKAPRGQIGRLAVFPSRGVYCAHYLWDACFTVLGAIQFNERLARDYLIALCENQEPDGKIPQFVCATWNRPGESQPPLIAWAAWRVYQQHHDFDLLKRVYEPIGRFIDWWFARRDSDFDGVVEYAHRLESGWDDSPRFAGRIAAVDLNSFLNREMRILADMARELERLEEAEGWAGRAAKHAVAMQARLFDPEDCLFYDRLVEEDTLHKVLTPASFMPLWTGAMPPGEVASRMISQYLLNPRRFFGARPFPVVAYSDPNYEPSKWWRGPVWPNVAWAMTEVLRFHGFERERKEAIRRLIEMMTASDELYELYDSSTGRPLGAPGLCWTCAVFMDMARIE